MARPSNRSGTPAAARFDAGVALVAIGAVLLFVSLFLHWYQPGRSAWTVFEAWDLVLAALSLAALAAVAGRVRLGPPRPDSWLVVPSVGAFVIVVASLLNHPPAAIGEGPMIGIWLALVAAVLMLVGVAVSVARVSIAINIHSDPAGAGSVPERPAARTAAGMRGRSFRRQASAAASSVPGAVPGPAPAPAGDAPTEATGVLGEDPPDSPPTAP